MASVSAGKYHVAAVPGSITAGRGGWLRGGGASLTGTPNLRANMRRMSWISTLTPPLLATTTLTELCEEPCSLVVGPGTSSVEKRIFLPDRSQAHAILTTISADGTSKSEASTTRL